MTWYLGACDSILHNFPVQQQIVSNLPPSQSFFGRPGIFYNLKNNFVWENDDDDPTSRDDDRWTALAIVWRKKKKAFTNTRNCPTSFSSPPCRFSFRKSYFFFAFSFNLFFLKCVASFHLDSNHLTCRLCQSLLCVTRATSPLSNKHFREKWIDDVRWRGWFAPE